MGITKEVTEGLRLEAKAQLRAISEIDAELAKLNKLKASAQRRFALILELVPELAEEMAEPSAASSFLISPPSFEDMTRTVLTPEAPFGKQLYTILKTQAVAMAPADVAEILSKTGWKDTEDNKTDLKTRVANELYRLAARANTGIVREGRGQYRAL